MALWEGRSEDAAAPRGVCAGAAGAGIRTRRRWGWGESRWIIGLKPLNCEEPLRWERGLELGEADQSEV